MNPTGDRWSASEARVKIADFGTAVTGAPVSGDDAPDGHESNIQVQKTAGTPSFFAPEMCVESAKKVHGKYIVIT